MSSMKKFTNNNNNNNRTINANNGNNLSSSSFTNVFIFEKFCSCLELWKGCILAGIFTMSTSVFDLLWSIAHMIDEDTIMFFYLLFALGIESVIFIAAIGLLFIALIKRSRFLLIPWLIMAFVDVFFSLMIAFAELAIQSNFNNSGCTVPAVSMVVTLLVCFITIYCWLCVYGQYLHYTKNNANVAEIKVTPIDPDRMGKATRNPQQQQQQQLDQNFDQNQRSHNQIISDHQMNTDTLKVPQVSTPRDAW